MRSSAFGSANLGAWAPGLSTRAGAPEARSSSTARCIVATISAGRLASARSRSDFSSSLSDMRASVVSIGTPRRPPEIHGCKLPALSTDDRELLVRTAAGDTGALETLMTRYSARVYRLAYGITRSAPDAEEVVQDVFLQVINKGAGFE